MTIVENNSQPFVKKIEVTASDSYLKKLRGRVEMELGDFLSSVVLTLKIPKTERSIKVYRFTPIPKFIPVKQQPLSYIDLYHNLRLNCPVIELYVLDVSSGSFIKHFDVDLCNYPETKKIIPFFTNIIPGVVKQGNDVFLPEAGRKIH